MCFRAFYSFFKKNLKNLMGGDFHFDGGDFPDFRRMGGGIPPLTETLPYEGLPTIIY